MGDSVLHTKKPEKTKKQKRGHRSGPTPGSCTGKIFLFSDRTFWKHLLLFFCFFNDKNKLILSLLNHFNFRPLTSYIFLVPHVVSLVHLRRELRVNITWCLVWIPVKLFKNKGDLCKCGNVFFPGNLSVWLDSLNCGPFYWPTSLLLLQYLSHCGST